MTQSFKKTIDNTHNAFFDKVKPSGKYQYSVKEGETIILSSSDATEMLIRLVETVEKFGISLGSVVKLKNRHKELAEEYMLKENEYKQKLDTQQRSVQGKIGNLITRQKQEQVKLDALQKEYNELKIKHDALQKEYDTLARSPVKPSVKTKKSK